MIPNYYRRLGVNLAASPEEIKRAYHREARQKHPDTGSGNTQDFVDLRNAYDVLSDPEKRAEYDQARQEWARLNGAFICSGCATPNFVQRRPKADERVVCSHCKLPLPVDLGSVVALQKQRLAAEAARVVDEVGAELATTAIDVAKAGFKHLRKRLTRSR